MASRPCGWATRCGSTSPVALSIKETGTQLYIPRAGRLLVITITTRAGHSADDVKKLVNGIELLD